MSIAKFEGNLTVGPTTVCENTFPSGNKFTGISLTPSNKPSNVDSGLASRVVSSPGAFIVLSGIGTNDDVSVCDTLYVKVSSPMVLRLTFAQIGSPDLVSAIPFYGTVLIESPPDQYIKLVEIKGSGRVEYLASGPQ